MRMFGLGNLLEKSEEDLVHLTMLRILDEVGLIVEDEDVIDKLGEFGGRVDRDRMKVSFSAQFVEQFIAESQRFDWESIKPSVSGHAGVYFGYYLDPETDDFKLWTLPDLLRYMKVAHYLPNTVGSISYAFPIDAVPNEALVPFFHYLSFKFMGRSGASLNNIRWCPIVLEMCEAFSEETGASIGQIFCGHVHLISPLKFGHEEAKIFKFFAERGLRVGIGNMSSMGGTAPVTLSGAIAIHLAQAIFINIIYRAYFGDKNLYLGCSISPLDMSTGIYPYGRPEKEICNVIMAQMARRYGAHYVGHTGHSDAKRPSVESGFQKALNSIPTLMVCGKASICCGLLSVDEVFSPIQMIIDDEIVSALNRFVNGFEVNEETLAFDVIKQVGAGGCFIDTEHTARFHRAEIWQPRIFARNMFRAWREKGAKIDAEIAKEMWSDIMNREQLPSRISQSLERKLLKIVEKRTGVKIEPIEAV
ncbi:MAG: trimethylamine methyltransferase family protein [Armatimonadetes bacterium]|nr:trimethylamine methyltransferase family protein [Armatimonadota bacterium]